MDDRPRRGFFRRLGQALIGVNAVKHGRQVPPDGLEPGPQQARALTLDHLPEEGSCESRPGTASGATPGGHN